MGQPVSLILARLQTTPQGCSCGCTEPAPPKHSDYYHAQHILQLIFQTQKIRSRSVKANYPEYFERAKHETGEDQRQGDMAEGGGEQDESHRPLQSTDGVSGCVQDPSMRQRRKKTKHSRYATSLIQNRTLRNPLTNMEIDGDPTFFVVLEPCKGGWWFEPRVMTPPAAETLKAPSFHTSHHYPDQHPQEENMGEPCSVEEEDYERLRQERIVHLEKGSLRELSWRRWQRSVGCSQKQVSRRLELSRDITLLEPWEHSLRLPRRNERSCEAENKENNTRSGRKSDVRTMERIHLSVKGSAALDDMELEDIQRQQVMEHSEQDSDLPQEMDPKDCVEQPSEMDKSEQQRTRAPSRRLPPKVVSWWDPDPRPFKMPITKLSPNAITTLPEAAAKHFGGTSIYARPHSSSRSEKNGENKNEKTSVPNETEDTNQMFHAVTNNNNNTRGCRWVPVPQGDRVAVMIGTSRDFLLFPSFQRLILRHMSRDDFEDRVGRTGVIHGPFPAVILGRQNRYGRSRRGEHTREQEVDDETLPGNRRSEERVSHHSAEVDASGQQGRSSRSWTSWIPGRTRRSSNVPTASRETRGTQAVAEEPVSYPMSSVEMAVHDGSPHWTDGDSCAKDAGKGRASLDSEMDEGMRNEWELYWETFEREDYDSSDYVYSSTDEDENLLFDPDEFSDSSDSSQSSDEDGPGTGEGRVTPAAAASRSPSRGESEGGVCDKSGGVSINESNNSKNRLRFMGSCHNGFSG
ncbi:hypothetical protein BGX34_011376 [Mortierella sp. NVP85]|nr:hypothetical protein BGX34_011376 [Mortierella sp. NVP85]